MPRLLLVSAFGHEDVAQNVKYFLEQLEHAENVLSSEEVAVLDNLVAKDRGPFLYWLVNERNLLVFAAICDSCSIRDSHYLFSKCGSL